MDDQIENGQLSQKHEEAILALINEASVAKAALKVGVAERTLYRWLEDPQFNAAYRRARREAYSQAIGLVQRYSSMAVNALAKVVADSGSPPSARVSAATAILKIGRDGIELDDLAARVEVLEQSAKQEQKKDSKWG